MRSKTHFLAAARQLRSFRYGQLGSSTSLDKRSVIELNGEISQPATINRRWTKGVLICAWFVSAVLAVNIILSIVSAILATTKYNTRSFAKVPIYQGSCSVAKNTATGIHLLINILSTIMLGASNYAMQCLVAPSRLEVDEAHKNHKWLKIGTPDVPTLIFSVRGRRRFLGCLLLITSLPIHLIYNSTVYYSMRPNEYPVVMASGNTPLDQLYPSHHEDDFEKCFKPNINMSLPEFHSAMMEKRYQILSKQECVDTFAQDFVFGQQAVVLVTNATLSAHETPLIFVGQGNMIDFASTDKTNFPWMCPSFVCSRKEVQQKYMANWMLSGSRWALPELNVSVPTAHGFENIWWAPSTEDSGKLYGLLEQNPSAQELQRELNDASLWLNSTWAQNVRVHAIDSTCAEDKYSNQWGNSDMQFSNTKYPIDHCLALPARERCQVIFSPIFSLVVICCNAIKLLCIILTARDSRDELLLTVGDAIASFLTRPDPATDGVGLLSWDLVENGLQGWAKENSKQRKAIPVNQEEACQFLPRRKRLFHAVSYRRCISTLCLCVFILASAGVALYFAIVAYTENYGAGSIWESGFGEPSSATVLGGTGDANDAGNVFSMILLANTPQVVVSAAYFLYNALLTSMLIASEYNRYATRKKPLRVSWPSGVQRSTYYLTIPYRYGMPLLAASALLHWLVSQSFFYVEIVPLGIHGSPTRVQYVTCGFSPTAIILAMILGSLLVLGAVLLGLRRLQSPMPLAAHCSAAISAACHPPSDSTLSDHASKPVQWGEVVQLHSPSSTGLLDTCADSSELHQQDASEPQQHRPYSREYEAFHCAFTSGEVCEPSPTRCYL
ncbi:hypothetical protein BDV59DRAFT_178049 [Aspergillus ambiguus]|uniref:uncharacterized protein n=1 Tax=Aspergillus ambiguus TaxID=176160 RepID=UPI003CCD8884